MSALGSKITVLLDMFYSNQQSCLLLAKTEQGTNATYSFPWMPMQLRESENIFFLMSSVIQYANGRKQRKSCVDKYNEEP